jgi:hypothetical protein
MLVETCWLACWLLGGCHPHVNLRLLFTINIIVSIKDGQPDPRIHPQDFISFDGAGVGAGADPGVENEGFDELHPRCLSMVVEDPEREEAEAADLQKVRKVSHDFRNFLCYSLH